MITREFDYTADRFDANAATQMATLRWRTLENGVYVNHSLRMKADGLTAAEHKALEIMHNDYPAAKLTVRRSFHNGRFHSEFLIDAK